MNQAFPKQIFVTGIGTGVGKTIVAAILTEALQADYWKPVQCGSLDKSDSIIVQSLISNNVSTIHPEAYRFKTAASPHYAAQQEEAKIDLNRLRLPNTNRPLVIEGAGGLMVPLNEGALVVDLIKQLNVPVVLVARNYLGSINHTLLSIEILKTRGIRLAGIIFNGKNYFDNEEIISHFGKVPVIGKIDETEIPNQKFTAEQAERFKFEFSKNFQE